MAWRPAARQSGAYKPWWQ